MSAASVFCTANEEGLYDLDCWIDFSAVTENVLKRSPYDVSVDNEKHEDGDGGNDNGGGNIDTGAKANGNSDKVNGNAQQDKEGETKLEEGDDSTEIIRTSRCGSLLEEATRRQETHAMVAWLRAIESRLAERCAEVCDTAWYELGETITYQGKPIAHSLPPEAMEMAMRRREENDSEQRARRPR